LTETVDEVCLAWAGHGSSSFGMRISRKLMSGQLSPVLAMRRLYDAKGVIQVFLSVQTINSSVDRLSGASQVT
jgi:hypothetical protein